MGKKQADHVEAIKIYDVLKGVCVKDDEGYANYANDWNDEAVLAQALEQGCDVGISSIVSIRTKMFGSLRPVSRKATLEQRLDEFEKRLASLEATAVRCLG